MRRIDKETRTRFQDTFERINAGLRDKFPRLFGGGHAYLELVGEDKLTPAWPSWRGHRARRTAPSTCCPRREGAHRGGAGVLHFRSQSGAFCLLDEVDAPLDEHNVGGSAISCARCLARAVRVHHPQQKTMELASQLIGVTMNEPGVSRLVTVDVDEAVRLARCERPGVHGMMSELRWTLLILGVVFIAALAWWERQRPRRRAAAARRSALARARAHRCSARAVREPSLSLPPMRAATRWCRTICRSWSSRAGCPYRCSTDDARGAGRAGAGSSGSGRCHPRSRRRCSRRRTRCRDAVDASTACRRGAARVCAALPRRPCQVDWPPDERRRVVALRLVAQQPSASRAARCARRCAEGFVLGRFAIFHKPTMSSAPCSVRESHPAGHFDVETMDSQHYGGCRCSRTAGPKPPPQAFDELIVTARNLNERLCGILQDEQGSPLTPARIALLRER